MTTLSETKGIVLKTMPYKEADKLVTVYSYDYGKITLVAKGTKKLTSKNAPSIQSLTYSEFIINLKKGLCPLIKGTALNYYRHIKDSIEYEIVADYLLEYYYRYVEENSPSKAAYQFLETMLSALDEGYSYLTVYALINCYILKTNGVSLFVDGCTVCKNSHVHAFSADKGAFVCYRHTLGEDKVLMPIALKALRHIYKCPPERIHELHLGNEVKDILPILDYYIDEYCGIHLKAKIFIQTIL